MAMQTALVVTWTHPIPGREEKALAYGADVTAFWGKKAAEGACTEPAIFFSESGRGLWFVKGDRDTLLQIGDTEEAKLLSLRGELLLENFNIEFFYADEDAADFMKRYASALNTIS
jgi:hypothetical protein